MAEWVRAAEVQLETYRWWTSPEGQRWLRGWIAAEKRSEARKGDYYDLLSHAEPSKLLTADAIWISPEMCEIVQAARDGFQPESMEREDFITHTGFAYFAHPLWMYDRSERKVSIGAMSWCPVIFKSEGLETAEVTEKDTDGMAITLYSSTIDPNDDYGEHLRLFHERYGSELVPLHLTTVIFGEPLDEGDLLDDEGRYTGADHWWKTVQSTLRLMQQRVFVQEEARLPRATRRRMQREGAGHIEEVLVIRLRRPSATRAEPEEPSGRTLTHRHLRDGHWRGQWYPSLQRHRQIWISPTIVGDENLPLVIKRRYYKWDR